MAKRREEPRLMTIEEVRDLASHCLYSDSGPGEVLASLVLTLCLFSMYSCHCLWRADRDGTTRGSVVGRSSIREEESWI